jgi:CDP-diacylglycerol--glycerol-3-phosphate 3-phosphatidyltransferase
MTKIIKSIPNYLTYLRILLIPGFIVLMHDPSAWMIKCALAVFVVAALTDLFDGFIARRFKAVSDLGKLLDPLADKILVMTALVMLTALRSDISGDAWVPGWLVVLVLAREIWVTGIRGVAAAQGIIVQARESGKVKSFLQMISIIFLLLHDQIIPLGRVQLPAQFIGLNLLFISLGFSYWSAYEYTTQILIAGKSDQDLAGISTEARLEKHVVVDELDENTSIN